MQNNLKHSHVRTDPEILRSMFIRGSYLHERTEQANIESSNKYQKQIDEIKKELGGVNSDFVKNYLVQLETQIKRTTKLDDYPDWYKYLLRSVKYCKRSYKSDEDQNPFLSVLMPFVEMFCDDLQKNPHWSLEDTGEDFIKSLSQYFLQCFSDIAGMTLYVDFKNYCKESGKRNGLAIYEEWNKEFSQDRWFDIAYQFPVLMRSMYEMQLNLCQNVLNLLERFHADHRELAEMLGSASLYLNNAEFGMSDFHNKGKTVCRLCFTNGKTVIYKPKPLANENWFFNNLLPAANYLEGAIGSIKILDKGHYGWAEDIGSLQEEENVQVRENIGQSVSLFYALNATDMHSENVVQKNGKIYPVDLETILNASRKHPDGEKQRTPWKSWSVLSTELLRHQISSSPQNNRGNGFSADVLISPFKKTVFYRSETEGIGIKIYDPQTIGEMAKADGKLGSLPEDQIDIPLVPEVFSRNFETLRKIASNENFFQNDVIAKCIVRSIFRDTMFYERMVERVRQPKLLTDGALLSLDLAGLMFPVKNMQGHECDHMAAIYHDEMLQLLGGDIPLFWHAADSKDLMSMNGMVVKDFFHQTGIEVFKAKLTEASNQNIKEQSYLIEASLLIQDKSLDSPMDKHSQVKNSGQCDEDEIVHVCREIGENIVARSIVEETSCAQWVSYVLNTAGNTMRPSVMNTSYYSGYWGILLFLESLQYILNERHEKSAPLEAFLERERNFWKKNYSDMAKISKGANLGIAGYGGQILSLSIIGTVNPTWDFTGSFVKNILRKMSDDCIEGDQYLDVTGGSAGLLLALTNFTDTQAFKTLSALEKSEFSKIAKSLASHLVKTAVLQKEGMGWIPKNGEKKALLGYAHGTSGIMTALQLFLNRAELFSTDYKSQQEIVDIIHEALKYQNSQKLAHGGWIDLREGNSDQAILNMSWCHGLPGLGFGFLSQLNKSRGDLADVYKGIDDNGEASIDYYCCGNCGTLDFLLEAARATGEAHLEEKSFEKMGHILFNLRHSQTFRSRVGDMKPEVFPGLFQGVSGIAYTALRFLDEKLPSLSGFKAQ